MAIRIIRELTKDFGMQTDTFAVLVHCPTLDGSKEYGVAWGKPADHLYSGIRPMGWSEDANGSENGVLWFDTLEEAEEYAKEVAECHLS
jgi:hypothetical protein